MLVAALVGLAVAAAPVSLALPEVNSVNLAPGEGALYAELLGQKLAGLGLKVVSSRDMGALLGLERQKELLGCSDTSCAAELSGALGVDGVVVGDVGKLGDSYQVNLKVLAADGRALALFNGAGADARSVLHDGARALAHQLAAAMHRPELEPPPEAEASPRRPRLLKPAGIAGVVGGSLLLGIGVGCLSAAVGKMTALNQAETLELAAQYRGEGKAWQAAGAALLGVGFAIAVAAGVLLVLGDEPAKAADLVAGRWP